MPPRQTIVYVDGFNLYYGRLKGTPHKWLDLGELSRRLLHQEAIVRIKYFTAIVKDHPGNPGAAARQQAYIRALATDPLIEVHYGSFLTHEVSKPLVNPPRRGRKFANVWITEEKGSDVNLASHLLIDGWRARYELAVVISNDSDLTEPVRMVRRVINAPVGVLNPHKRRSWNLSPRDLPSGSFYRPIRKSVVGSCQFPDELHDADGRTIRKPKAWRVAP